ncbi:MAG: carbohydrate-binding domain-containing protein [Eubacteriaceae bacterium]|nr:carbohydrate-binding domain-containing protein [Eubacteriaceae bacterium]
MKIKFNLILGILMILTPGLMLCLTGPAMAAQLAFGSENNYTTVTNWTDLQDTITASSSTNPAYLKLGTHLTNPNAPLTIGQNNVVFLDLNGKTLSRGLSKKKPDGHVIKIDGGTLTLNDLSPHQTGTITGGNTSGNGGGVYVTSNGTFTMNGGAITGNTSTNSNYQGSGGGVYLNDTNTQFTMNGGSIEGNSSTGDGGGVSVSDGSIFTMEGGTIQNNESINGGGVSVVGTNSKFFMQQEGATISSNTAGSQGGGVYLNGLYTEFAISGGTISNNDAFSGGGVYTTYGTITMSGGSISGNKAKNDSGGVNVGSNGILAMNGGTISGNTATTYGGGIYLNESSTQMTISGGTIQNNKAGSHGGGIYAGKSFTLQGTPTITGNIVNNKANNVFLHNDMGNDKKISIGTELTLSDKIGVTLANPDKDITSNANYANDTAAQAVFTSDNPAYEVYAKENQAALRAVPLNLWVGDDQVTGDHLSGTGWRFDPWTNTLTLENFTYSGGGHRGSLSGDSLIYGCIYYAGDKPLNLEIKDTNSLTNTNSENEDTHNSHGIYCTQNLTITGEGTLTTTSTEATGAMGINCSKFIQITSGTVEAKGEQYGILGQEGVTISGESVKAEGDGTNGSYGIYATFGKPLTIEENVKSVIISGTGAAVYGLSVKNDVKGFGWTDTEGKQGKTVIDINTTGQPLTYKKLQFPVYDVTFKVRGGAWNDGTTGDQTVTPDFNNKNEQILKPEQIPAVGARPSSGYKTGSWNVTPDTTTPITQNTTYFYSYAPKSRITRTVTFKVEHGAWDDGTTEDKTVTLTGYEGDTLKLKQDQIPAVGEKPDKRYTAGNWDTVPNPDTPITADTVYTYAYAKKPVIIPTLYFAAHVQNLGWDKENKTLEPGKSVDVGTTGRSLRMEAMRFVYAIPDVVKPGEPK